MLRIQAEALTYDDVSLVPAHSTVLPKDVSLATRLTRDLHIRLPIVSAAMDTVSESRLAIAMAQLGGISILHKNIKIQGTYVGSVAMFEAMNRAIALHRMKPVVDRVFPFHAAVDALDYLKSGSHFGKVVISL